MATSSRPARLNSRQGLFVEHYLIDLNGKAAAIRAGYTPAAATVRAAKLLRQPAVRQQIAAAMAASPPSASSPNMPASLSPIGGTLPIGGRRRCVLPRCVR